MKEQPRVTKRKGGERYRAWLKEKKALYDDDIISRALLLSRACDDGGERQRGGVSGVMFLHSVPVTTARKAEVAREARCLRRTTFIRLFASEHRLQRLDI